MSATLSALNQLIPNYFSQTALPNALAEVTTSAGYDASSSAFSLGTWNYNAALTPQLLSSALGEGEAASLAGTATLADLGGAEFADISSDFTNWGNSQEQFLSATSGTFGYLAKKSAKANSGGILGLFGF